MLQSYHVGMRWADSIRNGIESVFGRSEHQWHQLTYEYMDTKRISSEAYFEELARLYAMKYHPGDFDVMICSDDDAFTFLLNYGERLFGSTPIVFCGVNYFSDDRLAGRSNITGVVESYDLVSTLNVALRLHPDIRQILVINDRTVTGLANDKRVQEIMPIYEGRLNFRFTPESTMAEVVEQVEQMPPDGLVLLMSFNRDRQGTFYRYRDAAALVCPRSPVPVYSVWEFYLGDGIVGGMLTDGHVHGRTAAEMALRILAGERPADIPVVRRSPNQFMFDNTVLRRWGLPQSELPFGSIVINQPRTFYTVSRRAVWITLGGLATLGVLALVYGINITKRLQAQHDLRAANEQLRREIAGRQRVQEERERLAAALEQTDNAVMIADINGVAVYVNPAFERLTGYPAGETVGQPMQILRAGDSSSDIEREIWATLQRGESWAGHLKNRRKDGRAYEEDAVISPVRDANGLVSHYVAIRRDITQKVELQAQILEAQKMNSVGRIAGGIAHDFNNMLTVILNSAHFLAKSLPPDSKPLHDLEEIILTTHRASALTRELLSFARRQPLNTAVQDLNQVVSGMRNMLQRLLTEKIQLHLQTLDEEALVEADKSRIEQALLNLAANARDAMPEGGLLRVSVTRVNLAEERSAHFVEPPDRSGREYCRLSVQDTGCGMNEDTRARIFEPFFTTKQEGEGTGLGLPVVYGIVKQHGGYVAVSSSPGAGSVFNLYLPIVEEPTPGQPASVLAGKAPGGTETILVAEDERAVRQIIVRIIRSLGYTVFEAGNGRQALEVARQHPGTIHLLFADVLMPEMDGPALARQLARERPGIRVIFASGYSQDLLNTQDEIIRHTPLLKKPFEAGQVARVIREVLEKTTRPS